MARSVTRQNAKRYMNSHVQNGSRHANVLNYMRLTEIQSLPPPTLKHAVKRCEYQHTNEQLSTVIHWSVSVSANICL